MNSSTLALAAVAGLSALGLGWRIRSPGRPDEGGRDRAARTSVVVPARDEAERLPRLLRSLAQQDPPPAELLVVDDGSSDATAAVAAEHGARVVPAGPLGAGWAGKPWACAVGVRAANGEHLVLLDADTWLAPDGLARLWTAQHALAADGLLSVQPKHVTEQPYEQLSAVCNAVVVLASGMAGLRVPRRPGLAFGPCLVTSRSALAAAGGFEAVAGESIEDVALARAFERAGRPVVCLAGGDAVQFRMYPSGLRSLAAGWSKNLAGGARRAPLVPLLGAVAWVAGLVAVSVDAATDPGPAVAVVWCALAAQFGWLLHRIGSFRWWAWAAFPVPLAAFLVLFARSAVLRTLRGEVAWKGRRLDVSASRRR